jgi:hypothetical protein
MSLADGIVASLDTHERSTGNSMWINPWMGMAQRQRPRQRHCLALRQAPLEKVEFEAAHGENRNAYSSTMPLLTKATARIGSQARGKEPKGHHTAGIGFGISGCRGQGTEMIVEMLLDWISRTFNRLWALGTDSSREVG